MAIPYSPPNVTVSEVVDPSVAPLIAIPSLVSLVGMASGAIVRSRTVTLTATDDNDKQDDQVVHPIPGVPDKATVQEVLSVEKTGYGDTATYVETDDYILNLSADPPTITRTHGGDIDDGQTPTAPNWETSVRVTYLYAPDDYYSPILMSNMTDIEGRFGSSWAYDSDSRPFINSPITYAASVLFENGASEVVLQPLFVVDSDERRQPKPDPSNDNSFAGSEVALPSTWGSTLEALRDIADINVVIPVVGDSHGVSVSNVASIAEKFQDHAKYMKDEEQEYLMVIWGQDGSIDPVDGELMRQQAESMRDRRPDVAQQMVMVSPSRFIRQYGTSFIPAGGQYMATAIAGMIAARPVHTPVTRSRVMGFVEVADSRSKRDMNSDAAAGMTVIERKGNSVQVRHAITMDSTSTANREISVVRAKHRVIESVRATIDTQIIGKVIADGEAPTVVRSAVIGVLDQLRGLSDIVSYTDVQSRTVDLDPTTIEVRFSYAPAFPVNYVNVIFSLDLTGTTDTLTNIEA